MAGAFRVRAGCDFGRSTDKERDDERGRRSEERDGLYMVPRGSARKVAAPVALSVGAVRLDGRQCFVTRHVVGGRSRIEPTRRYGAKRSSYAKSTAMKAGVTSPR